MPLLLLFIAIPIIEITLFIQIGGVIGLGWTLFIVIATAIIGATMVRTQGAMALQNVRRSFSELTDPSEPLAHGAMILFSGALLLTPGFFTDAVGFALLIPAVRSAVFNWMRARVNVQGFTMQEETYYESYSEPRPQHKPKDVVIDADFEDIPRPDARNNGPSKWSKD